MSAEKFWSFFYEKYEAIPRQGPGDRESTERALRLLPPLARSQRILDIGCGTGAQTTDIARAAEAQIVAVDSHALFVAQLARRAAESGLALRRRVLHHDAGKARRPRGITVGPSTPQLADSNRGMLPSRPLGWRSWAPAW
jgi:cyclopropane fatty-acyl-phospholipid synthase-like methyltransferase